jgi:hypothetical protein
MSGIAPKQNTFKFKIAPHKQKSIVKMLGVSGRKMCPLANGALCLSTPKHNGKSGQSNILAILWGEQVNFQ